MVRVTSRAQAMKFHLAIQNNCDQLVEMCGIFPEEQQAAWNETVLQIFGFCQGVLYRYKKQKPEPFLGLSLETTTPLFSKRGESVTFESASLALVRKQIDVLLAGYQTRGYPQLARVQSCCQLMQKACEALLEQSREDPTIPSLWDRVDKLIGKKQK